MTSTLSMAVAQGRCLLVLEYVAVPNDLGKPAASVLGFSVGGADLTWRRPCAKIVHLLSDTVMPDDRYRPDRVKSTKHTRKNVRPKQSAAASGMGGPGDLPPTSPKASTLGVWFKGAARRQKKRVASPIAKPTEDIPGGHLPMNAPAEARPTLETEIGAEVIDMVPHWYTADCGPEQYSFSIGQHLVSFYNHR